MNTRWARRLMRAIVLMLIFLILISMFYGSIAPSNIETTLIPTQMRPIIKYIDFHSTLPMLNGISAGPKRNLAKYIHLDLKGAPPRARPFYEPFFKFLNELNMDVKGVVMEYEDMLPLTGRFENATNLQHYDRKEVESIQSAAAAVQMEIIPLIQTFGHLEWVLKLKEFAEFRDDPRSSSIISPCFDQSYILLEDLLRQVLELHPTSTAIHIGCDEVELKNLHVECRWRRESSAQFYIKHIERVVEMIKKIRPTMRILIWDDILRNPEIIEDSYLLNKLKGLIEPVSWNYYTDFDDSFRNSRAWKIYPNYFNQSWAASAFKGGLYRHSMLTNTTHHVLNNQRWIHFIQSSTIDVSAIILTGWSRFDHFMPLCDLLPTAYASLILSLHVLTTNQFVSYSLEQTCFELLTSIGKDGRLCRGIPGRSIWENLKILEKHLTRTKQRLKFFDTVIPQYNHQHEFVRQADLPTYLEELKVIQERFESLNEKFRLEMSNLYTDDVIDEWFELYVQPTTDHLVKTIDVLTAGSRRDWWPRRPFISNSTVSQ